jgi:hypothetical protein
MRDPKSRMSPFPCASTMLLAQNGESRGPEQSPRRSTYLRRASHTRCGRVREIGFPNAMHGLWDPSFALAGSMIPAEPGSAVWTIPLSWRSRHLVYHASGRKRKIPGGRGQRPRSWTLGLAPARRPSTSSEHSARRRLARTWIIGICRQRPATPPRTQGLEIRPTFFPLMSRTLLWSNGVIFDRVLLCRT